MVARILAAVAALAVIAVAELSACGDKFLLIGRPIGYNELHKAARPGNILIFSGTSTQTNPLSDRRLAALLDVAGHRYRAVKTREELDKAFSEQKFDLILINAGSAPEIAAREPSTTPLVVPVVTDAKKSERSAIERRFGIVLRFPATPRQVVDTLDKAMKLRASRAWVAGN
jgi:hypothetical protein